MAKKLMKELHHKVVATATTIRFSWNIANFNAINSINFVVKLLCLKSKDQIKDYSLKLLNYIHFSIPYLLPVSI